MDGDHPFLSRCVVSFSLMVCGGHHVSLRLLSLLREMNMSPSPQKKKKKNQMFDSLLAEADARSCAWTTCLVDIAWLGNSAGQSAMPDAEVRIACMDTYMVTLASLLALLG